jgi:FtsZ-binding cell division protein ZapB
MKKTKDNDAAESEILERLTERVEKAITTIQELRREREELRRKVEELEEFRRERGEIRERIETILNSLEALETE